MSKVAPGSSGRLTACLVGMVVFFSVLLATPLCASEYEDIVERAFATMDDSYEESWSFTEVSMREEVRYEASFDPRRKEEERWILVSVDGREPTKEETEDFLEEKAEILEEEAMDERENEVDMAPGTLTLLEETGEYWLFSFVPADEEEGEKFMKHVDGTMKVVKEGHYVEFIDLRSPEPFKPAMGVKIKTFLTRITFGPAVPDGPVVPMSVDVRVEGSALFAIKFDEAETIQFLDYEYVGEN